MKSDFKVDRSEEERLKAAQAQIRANATPAQLQILNEADRAFNEVVAGFDERDERETELRRWARNLCGFDLNISEIEQLNRVAKCMVPGTTCNFVAQRGSVNIYKTAFGTIDRVERYVQLLERTVIDVTNSSQFTVLPFRGLIKLAFSRLLNRRKQ